LGFSLEEKKKVLAINAKPTFGCFIMCHFFKKQLKTNYFFLVQFFLSSFQQKEERANAK
jgi:hypothetical protein